MLREHRGKLVEIAIRDSACAEQRLVNRVVEIYIIHRLVEGGLRRDTRNLDLLDLTINYHLLLSIGSHLSVDDEIEQARRRPLEEHHTRIVG